MKPFSEMSQSEIDAMTKEDFKAVSPFEKKSCYDCGDLKQALSYWCKNKDAIKLRGTSIPGCIKCPYWTPDWKYIDDKYKTEENGYVKPIENVKQTTVKWYQRILNYLSKKIKS
jgi:hypothetical protein